MWLVYSKWISFKTNTDNYDYDDENHDAHAIADILIVSPGSWEDPLVNWLFDTTKKRMSLSVRSQDK